MTAGRVVTSRAQGTDEQLVAAAQAGDTTAAAELAERFERFTGTVARRYFDSTGGNDDLLQEAYIGLLDAIRDWRPGLSSFRSFAGLCVGRQLMEHLTRTRRVKHRPLTYAVREAVLDDGTRVDVLDTLEAARTDPVEIIGDRERFAALVAVFRDGLTVLEADAAVAFFFNGDSYEEIAARRGSTEKAVDNALGRARQKLRVALVAFEGPPPFGVAA